MNKPRYKERGKGKNPSKTAFIHMRVSEEDKSRLQHRAKAAGMSLTDYLIDRGTEDKTNV